MEIFDNPLKLENLSIHVEQAVARSSTPSDAYQEVLHSALRNCIWDNNIACMKGLLETYGGIDLDRTFRKGSLLCYAASAPLLAQGQERLKPLELLVNAGADLSRKQDYHLLPEHYRQPKRAYHGSFVDYIDHIATALKTCSELAVATSGGIEKSCESVAYIKSLIAARGQCLAANGPELSQTQPCPAEGLEGVEGFMSAVLHEVVESRQQAARPVTAAPEPVNVFNLH